MLNLREDASLHILNEFWWALAYASIIIQLKTLHADCANFSTLRNAYFTINYG